MSKIQRERSNSHQRVDDSFMDKIPTHQIFLFKTPCLGPVSLSLQSVIHGIQFMAEEKWVFSFCPRKWLARVLVKDIISQSRTILGALRPSNWYQPRWASSELPDLDGTCRVVRISTPRPSDSLSKSTTSNWCAHVDIIFNLLELQTSRCHHMPSTMQGSGVGD